MSTHLCPECGGTNGAHGVVHVRHPQGGGGTNRPCPHAAGGRLLGTVTEAAEALGVDNAQIIDWTASGRLVMDEQDAAGRWLVRDPQRPALRWVTVNQSQDFATARHRHLVASGKVTSLCGTTGLPAAVWRANRTKPECPGCLSYAQAHAIAVPA